MGDAGDPYIMGAHEAEVRRLTTQHEVITESTGKLVFSPVDLSKSGLRILDSATADGRWLLDLRDLVQKENEYIGTDITDGMFPSAAKVPKDLSFHIQDICSPWPAEWKASFDYVHQRLGIAGIGGRSIPDVLKGECELLKPGGWIELVELDISEENARPAVEKLYKVIREMFGMIGCGSNFCGTLKGILEGAGLEDVRDDLVEVKLGAAAKTPELGAKGIKSMQLAAEGFVDVAGKLPLSFSKEEIQGLIGELQEDLGSQGGSYVLRTVYGRKPAEASPYSIPMFAPKQARKPSPALYSALVKDTTVDVASHAIGLLGSINSGSTIHDNGCGCLEATRAIQDKVNVSDVAISATDVDPAMLERAKELCETEKWNNVTVSNAPAEHLSFPDNHFSHSITNIVIFMTANDGVSCAQEIFRTLKPGGRAAVTTWATMPHGKPVDDAHHTLRGDDAELMFTMPEKWWTASHLESVMQAGGFKTDQVTIETCEVVLKIEEAELQEYAAMIWSLRGMPKGGWQAKDEERWDEAIELIVDGLKKISDTDLVPAGAGIALRMIANIAVCTK